MEKLNNLPKEAQPVVSDGVGIQTQVVWLRGLLFSRALGQPFRNHSLEKLSWFSGCDILPCSEH